MQEVLLILDEYWEAHPELQNVPIYYASTLAQKCMKVYQAYINMMNERIRAQYTISNPLKFNHISYLKGIEHFDDIGPSVVMASPGMLQSGLSRDLFERWAPDKKNGVVLTGYSVEVRETGRHDLLRRDSQLLTWRPPRVLWRSTS